MSQKDAMRAEEILEARTKQILESLYETYGNIPAEVLFLAIARWFGTFIFNCTSNAGSRREIVKKFAAQIDEVISLHEKGTTPWIR